MRIIKKEPLEREITLPQMRADHVVLTLRGRAGVVVYIVEFLARWKSNAPLRMRLYARAAELRHLAPVHCLLVVMSRKKAPGRIPAVHQFAPEDRHPFGFDGTRRAVSFRGGGRPSGRAGDRSERVFEALPRRRSAGALGDSYRYSASGSSGYNGRLRFA